MTAATVSTTTPLVDKQQLCGFSRGHGMDKSAYLLKVEILSSRELIWMRASFSVFEICTAQLIVDIEVKFGNVFFGEFILVAANLSFSHKFEIS